MKRFFSFSLFCLLWTLAWADNEMGLFVVTPDETKAQTVASLQQISFTHEPSMVQTSADGSRKTLPLAEVSRMYFAVMSPASERRRLSDVNRDENVDISDIVAIINQIAGASSAKKGDVNQDGATDISDIVAVINVIASPEKEPADESYAQQAFYVYRNDGQFNAFLCQNVDSMVFSKYGLDSVLHEDVVVQDFYLSDSVVRIPLNVVDSIGFHPLQNKYKAGVIRIDDKLVNYIDAANDSVIWLKTTVPDGVVPRVGDRLVTENVSELFPNALAGRVVKVSKDNSRYKLDYEWIGITDVFDTYFNVTTVSVDGTHAKMRDGAGRRNVHLALDPIDYTYNLADFSKKVTPSDDMAFSVGASANVNFHLQPTVDVVQVVLYGDRHIDYTFSTVYQQTFSLNVYGEVNYEKSGKLFSVAPTVPGIPFLQFYLDGYWNFNFDGKLAWDYTKNCSYKAVYKGHVSTNKNLKDFFSYDVSRQDEGNEEENCIAGNMDLRFALGLEAGLRITEIFDEQPIKAKVYAAGEVGVRGSFNIPYDRKSSEKYIGKPTELYEILHKDSKAEAYVFAEARLGASGKFILWENKKEAVFNKDLFKLFEKKLFPTFDDTKFNKKTGPNKKTTLSANISDDLMIPVGVGFKIYDDKDKEVYSVKHDQKYGGKKSFSSYILEYDGTLKLLNKKGWKVYPYFTFLGHDITATPSGEIDLSVKAVTDKAENVELNGATVKAHIDGDKEYVQDDTKFGFVYGLDEDLESQGTTVYATLQKDGTFSSSLSGLKAGKVYYYKAFVEMDNEKVFGEVMSFRTSVPVEITKFVVNSALYYPGNFEFNGEKYDFKYNCTTYIKLLDSEGVEDWGYIYHAPDGTTPQISLSQFGRNSLSDPRYAYCRNAPEDVVVLQGYVKYQGESDLSYGEKKEFPIAYPADCSLQLTGCEFVGTVDDVTYKGKDYEHRSTFRFLFNASGAYWLKVKTSESGSGWDSWDNLVDEQVMAVDGENVLTVNYYYNSGSFRDGGEYKVGLVAEDQTHESSYTADGYVSYTYNYGAFTGCTPHLSGESVKSRDGRSPALPISSAYPMTINIISNQ